MSGKPLTSSEKVDRLATDVAVLSGQVGEMSKRLDDQSKAIDRFSDISTEIKVSITKLEGFAQQNKILIESNNAGLRTLKEDLTSNFKTWLTVFGIALSVITFIINYFKV